MSKKRPVRKTKKSTPVAPRFSVTLTPTPHESIKTVMQLVEEEVKRREELAKRIGVVIKARIRRTISWPRTWWDHLKQDLFPLWVKARWPVDYEEHVYWEEVPTEQCQASVQPFPGVPAVTGLVSGASEDNMARTS